MTEELLNLFKQYAAIHHSVEPDNYDEICYDAMTYDELVGYIKKCLETGEEMPEIVD